MKWLLVAVTVAFTLDASPRPKGAAAKAAVPAFGGHGLVSRASQAAPKQAKPDPKDILLTCDFEDDTWRQAWEVRDSKSFSTVEGKTALGGKGRSLKMEIPAGSCGGSSLVYRFQQRIGREPEEMYFRYYVKFDRSWADAVDGGKMPGFAGTYGRAGSGGAAVDGKNAWSARGGFLKPTAESTSLSYYCYHADQKSNYGDHWKFEPPLKYDKWYCVELYCKLNTPGKAGGKGLNDGILRSWIDGKPAFEKKDIRFRDVDTLKIEQVWGNFYHGGMQPTPKPIHLYIDDMVISTKPIGLSKTPGIIGKSLKP